MKARNEPDDDKARVTFAALAESFAAFAEEISTKLRTDAADPLGMAEARGARLVAHAIRERFCRE